MAKALATFFALGLLSLPFVGLAWGLTYRLYSQPRRRQWLHWMAAWSVKGLLVPFIIWILMNVGLSRNLQPFMPSIQEAQNSGQPWFPAFASAVAMGFFILSSYWTTLTLGWATWQASRGLKGELRSDFGMLCLTAFVLTILPIIGIIYLGGWEVVGLSGALLLVPIAGYAPSIVTPRQTAPMYARAVARMKFGKYNDAEWEIIHQLENREDDFEGWLMLAELYATHFRDLSEAEQTILEICDQPKTTPSQISIALQKLADWHLKYGENPEAAGRALQMICSRFPGSHLARMALLRFNHLPRDTQELREEKSAAPIPLPALGDQLYEPIPVEDEMDTRKASELANACVDKLNLDPNNVTAREKLARILTERLQKPDLGIDQLTLLLNMPDQPDAKRADWLGTVGAWHLRYRQDIPAGRRVLERVIEEFPNSPQAIAARRRLRLLDQERM
jgi:hypothetical protein